MRIPYAKCEGGPLRLRLCAPAFGKIHGDLPDDRQAFGRELFGAGDGHGEVGEFLPLERGFNLPKARAVKCDLVGHEGQQQGLRPRLFAQFGVEQVLERKKNRLVSGCFDSDRVRVRVDGPAFGWFCEHGFVGWVDVGCDASGRI